MSKESTLRKVRSLLDKQGAGGVTPAEAAASMALAAKLIERDGITDAMLAIDEGVEDHEETKKFSDPLYSPGKSMPTWRGTLGVVLGNVHGCVVYRDTGCLYIIGKPSNAEALRFTYEYCSGEIERISKLNCKGEGRTYANNFRHGCVDAIRAAVCKEMRNARQELKQEAEGRDKITGGNSALVLVHSAIARVEGDGHDANLYGKAKLNLRTRNSSITNFDYGAHVAGRQAGAGIYGGSKQRIGSGARGRLSS